MKIYKTIFNIHEYISSKLRIEREKQFYRNLSDYGTAHKETIRKLEKEFFD